jgi:uncharacterized cysteine cluster protein YcgN (CxxCxxCC family)
MQANFFPLMKGETYINSFYKDGTLYICTDSHEMRIVLKKQIKIGEKLVEKMDTWPRVSSMVSIHQGKPVYKVHTLVQGKIIEDGKTFRVEIQSGSLASKTY